MASSSRIVQADEPSCAAVPLSLLQRAPYQPAPSAQRLHLIVTEVGQVEKSPNMVAMDLIPIQEPMPTPPVVADALKSPKSRR